MRSREHLIFFVVFALAATTAAAQADDVSRAKDMYGRGKERFDRGDYPGAIADFSAADQIVAKAAFSFNLAKAYEKLGEPGKAVYYFQQYLERDSKASDRTQVVADVARLRAEMKRLGKALVVVISTPSGAAVLTSGAFVGVTPLPLTLSEGTHVFRLESSGLPSEDASTAVVPGDVKELRVALNTPPPQRMYSPPPPVAARPPPPVYSPPPAPAPAPAPPAPSPVRAPDDWSAPAPAPAAAVATRPTASPPPLPPPPPPPEVPPLAPPPLAMTSPAAPPPSDPLAVKVSGTGRPDSGVTTAAPSRGPRALTILKWTGVGLTTVAAGVGGYFAIDNMTAANQLKDPTTPARDRPAIADRGNTSGTIANVMLATVGVLAVATVVAFVLDR